MKDENKELLNDSLLIKAAKDSYIKKEDFIRMIENLNFTEIKNFECEFITGYQIKKNDNDQKYVQTLGFDIRIDYIYTITTC